MFIVTIHDNLRNHKFCISGHGKEPYDTIIALIFAFQKMTHDWREPVYATILSDHGTFYKDSNICAENVVKDGEPHYFALNDAAKKEMTAQAAVLPKEN